MNIYRHLFSHLLKLHIPDHMFLYIEKYSVYGTNSLYFVFDKDRELGELESCHDGTAVH